MVVKRGKREVSKEGERRREIRTYFKARVCLLRCIRVGERRLDDLKSKD